MVRSQAWTFASPSGGDPHRCGEGGVQLEEQLTKLREAQATLREELVRGRLDQWKGRIEDLEVQVHLATMGSNERLDGLTDHLRQSWESAKAQLDEATSTASSVVGTVLSGLENAYHDLRQALLDSRSKISS